MPIAAVARSCVCVCVCRDKSRYAARLCCIGEGGRGLLGWLVAFLVAAVEEEATKADRANATRNEEWCLQMARHFGSKTCIL